MTKVQYQTEINAPVQRVYEYYTNPNNIQEAWPHDIVKESEDVSGSKNEEGSQMRVKGQYMGKEEEMRLQVVDKEEWTHNDAHNDAGTYMLVTCLLLLLVGLPAYLIHRTLFHVRIKAMNNNNRLE